MAQNDRSARPTTAWADAQRIHGAAFEYRRRGWSVIPLRPRGKAPLIRWEEFKRRPPDQFEVEGWFRRWPFANVGIVTGRVSHLVVLDVDPRHGGEASLADWAEAHGALPETVAARTGGGGLHLYFAAPEPTLRNRVAIMPGIDLRAEGGLVVAPPSIHPSGRHYAWEVSHQPSELAPADLPAWLLDALQRADRRRGHPLAYWRELAASGVDQGRRNATIASLTGHLLWHGVDPDVVLELLLCWNRERCRPPLDDAEVVRVVDSIIRLHEMHEH